MTSILLTGFESFDGREVNQSWRLANTLKEELASDQVHALLLPVVFGKSHPPVFEWLDRQLTQTLIVSLGEATVAKIQLECVGLNKRHTSKPDNSGLMVTNQSVDLNGPLALETNWNLVRLQEKMHANGYILPLSFSAGTYLCNELLYQLLTMERPHSGRAIRTSFLHVPITQSDADFAYNIQWLKTFVEVLKGEMDVPTRN